MVIFHSFLLVYQRVIENATVLLIRILPIILMFLLFNYAYIYIIHDYYLL